MHKTPVKYQGSTSVGALSSMLIRCKDQLAWYQDLKADPMPCALCWNVRCSECTWSYMIGTTCEETGVFIKRDRVKRKNRIAQLKRWIVRLEKEIADRG